MQVTTARVPAGSIYRDRQRGGWVADFDWPSRGIRRRWRAPLRRDAEASLAAYRQNIIAGLDPTEVTFRSLSQSYLANLARYAKPATVAHATWALRHAVPAIGDLLVAEITPTHIERVLVSAGAAGLSPRSVGAVRKQVRAVLERAVRDRLVARNVADFVDAPRAPRPQLQLPPTADVQALLDQMKTEGHPSWPLLHVIAAGALRTSEARSLRWSDVHRGRQVIHVAGQLARDGTWDTPKTDAGIRDVPITSRMAVALDEAARRQEGCAPQPVYVFAGPTERPPAPWTAYKAWKRFQLRQWGQVRMTVHQLRHLALSALIQQAGVSLADAAAFAGHRDSRILAEVYAHALDDHPRRVRDALERGGIG